eukprot:TRINITY_DN28564_c0_g1_i2.p1 TRINITY_DN28564_c0_g1~~TRINITY_DN28564_c0_g1_i2.p1  ORF type:complete len:337 (+),score=55.56 TRINITY_DN28564_c0_g1_i2:58-1068(+)
MELPDESGRLLASEAASDLPSQQATGLLHEQAHVEQSGLSRSVTCAQRCTFVVVLVVIGFMATHLVKPQHKHVSAEETLSQPHHATLPPPPIATTPGPTTTTTSPTTTTTITTTSTMPPAQRLNVSSSSSRAMEFYDKMCYYKYDGKASADCFCKLAHNERCREKRCSCPQGCSKDITWRHSRSTTFRNVKEAAGCGSQSAKALLTVPESYFQDIRYLKTWCPLGAISIMTEMLQESFETYQQTVGPGSARQCLHAANGVSQNWLHLHTFCGSGNIDGMPSAPHQSWCSTMTDVNQAEALAVAVMEWAQRLYGRHSSQMPSTCSEMGCNIRGLGGG